MIQFTTISFPSKCCFNVVDGQKGQGTNAHLTRCVLKVFMIFISEQTLNNT